MEKGEERGVKFYSSKEAEMDTEVFFNKEMRTNRDLSAIAAKVYSRKIDEEMRICDALAASGIRGMRYTDSGKVWMNDANPSAIEAMKKGLEENDLDAEVSEQDTNVFLSQSKNFYHFVDIDPYGSFVNFLDSAARATHHNGFAGFSATDNAAPAGSYPTVCQRRYGSKPLKNSFMHETGLRIYLKEVFENYARYDKAFDPKICWHERHYTRIMGRVTESKQRCNNSLENIGYISHCSNCGWRKLERIDECPRCETETQKAGPLWIGKIADRRFTQEMLKEIPEEWEDSVELLEKVHGEAEIVTPYYDIHELCSKHKLQVPKLEEVIESLEQTGYPVSPTHFCPTGIRTDAPLDDVLDIIKIQSE
ncbi:tRNA (guanine(10)-N(2))-dimethyltransferase [Candidatus Nanohalobium constans]|uniref:tRNA (guanine(26)-N(2))-dimethyltransferase n=1 Tax=Candidatus Nanohalobium constans TaxID=2565781 RepID=A0A5Q0UGE9_9ARCH|nr:tRNA (guanine(10)-N(2))-dimethyltransferase [Candidatus Nanohalobium constans]QGA80722.1 tRNA (guanine26-N2/guanine27-N2)-dimethyltransferase [Candidatus Nanohalobium constans]